MALQHQYYFRTEHAYRTMRNIAVNITMSYGTERHGNLTTIYEYLRFSQETVAAYFKVPYYVRICMKKLKTITKPNTKFSPQLLNRNTRHQEFFCLSICLSVCVALKSDTGHEPLFAVSCVLSLVTW